MGILRRIAGFLGFVKDEGHEAREDDDGDADDLNDRVYMEKLHHPRKGFSVPVQLPVDRAPAGPVLIPCNSGEGGVQGLRWYAKRLRVDEDGDVADEFMVEVNAAALEKPSAQQVHRRPPFPRFESKCGAPAAKVRSQVLSTDGGVRHCVEHQGRLQWV